MVEFVLVLPLLMLVLFGIIQFGITFTHYVALTDAVRAGARTARRIAPVSTRARRRQGQGHVVVGRPGSTRRTSPSRLTWMHGDDVVVKATVPYSISLLGIGDRVGKFVEHHDRTRRIETGGER